MSCTGIKLTSKQDHHYWGRTQEFDMEFDYIGIAIPKGFNVELSFIDTQAKYDFGGIGIRNEEQALHFVADGVNEAGLCGGTHYFGTYNRYLPLDKIKALRKAPLSGVEFVTWALANCATVAEVKQRALNEVAITDAKGPFWSSFPQHYVFQDPSGASIVIEPSIYGSFEIYDNPVGIFTNSPKFDWHLMNLQNYVGLTDQITPSKSIAGLDVVTSGKGSGLFGLPGDFTPQSRFVRAAILKDLANPVDDPEAISLLFHLLDTSDIPKGVVKTDLGVQYTQYTSGYDLTRQQIYVHVYDNRQIQMFSLAEVKGRDELLIYEIEHEQKIAPMQLARQEVLN